MSEKKAKLLFNSIAVACTVVFLALLLWVIVLFFERGAVEREKLRKQKQLAQMVVATEELQNGVTYAKSAKFLEEYARGKLGWAKEGEIIFIKK